MKTTKLISFIIPLCLSVTLSAKDVYNVDELILLALKNAPDLQSSAAQYEASKMRVEKAFGSYLPLVDMHLAAGQQGMSDIAKNKDEMVSDRLLMGRLTLSQLLYDFGKTASNVESYDFEAQAFSMSNEQKISDKMRDVKSAYFNVLQALALIKVSQESISLNEAQLYRSQKYFQAGIRTKIDISDAKIGLLKAQKELKNSKYNLKIAYASLDNIVGFTDINNDYSVFANQLDLNTLYSTLNEYDMSLEEAVAFAYENRFEIKKQLSSLKATQAKSAHAQTEYYPTLYAGADYTKQSLDKFKDSLPSDQWQASLNLDWNLYKGGASEAAIQEKKIDDFISQSALMSTKLSIKKEATTAFINMYKNKDNVELSQNLLEASKEKFGQASQRYENGLSDYIELQQSKQDYIDAMAALVVDYYSYHSAIAILNNAIGRY